MTNRIAAKKIMVCSNDKEVNSVAYCSTVSKAWFFHRFLFQGFTIVTIEQEIRRIGSAGQIRDQNKQLARQQPINALRHRMMAA
jgi:hypothetical protein